MSDLYIRTFGRFQIVDRDGKDRTPRSRKACAIVAILLDAPEFTRTRARVQDLLWSDRAPAQGAASLRQDLSQLRRSLGPFSEALQSDSRTVSLRGKDISTDLTDPREQGVAAAEGRLFLEDIDIRDPEFEDWLRDRRSAIEGMAGSVPKPETMSPQSPGVPVLILSVDNGGIFGTHIAQSIMQGVANIGAARMFTSKFDTGSVHGARAFRLKAEEHSLSDGAMVRLQMEEVSENRICWTSSHTLATGQSAKLGLQIDRLINLGVDRAIGELAGSGPSILGKRRGELFFRPVQQMFATLAKDRETLRRGMADAYHAEGRGVYLAWQAFMVVYEYGERRRDELGDLEDEARELIRRAIEIEPHNPIVLALASHVYSFVFREFHVAHELAERSLQISQSSVLGWLFLGSAKTYLGQLEDGRRCIRRARAISGEGPYRPLVDFFAGMSALVTGRLAEGMSALRLAHETQPDFLPPLRYLLLGYLKTNESEKVSEMTRRLRLLEPSFELSTLALDSYPVRKIGHLDSGSLSSLT